MTNRCRTSLLAILAFSVTGCGTSSPLVFGQTDTVGLTIASSPAEGGGELTFGYRGRNIALIPVAVENGEGDQTLVQALAEDDFRDSLSVLGQFDAQVDGNERSVALGRFFATGIAARFLAEGFAAKLSNSGNEQE